MTTTPPEEPQGSGVPPTPPPSYQAPTGGYQAPPPGYQAPPPAYGTAPTGAPLSDSDQRMWATIAHIGPVIASFVAPLVISLVFKGRGQFVEEQAKEALNFQITVAIAAPWPPCAGTSQMLSRTLMSAPPAVAHKPNHVSPASTRYWVRATPRKTNKTDQPCQRSISAAGAKSAPYAVLINSSAPPINVNATPQATAAFRSRYC